MFMITIIDFFLLAKNLNQLQESLEYAEDYPRVIQIDIIFKVILCSALFIIESLFVLGR